MPNSIRTSSNMQFINGSQRIIDSFCLLNLKNLSIPLQSLAEARYFLSVIHDEISHTNRDGIFNRGKVSGYAANLFSCLNQYCSVFLSNDDAELADPLPLLAKQLYHSLYANEGLEFNTFRNIVEQALDIHERLEQIIMLAFHRQVEG